MNIVERKDLPEEYHQMMETEAHHDHEIVEDDNGVLRWKRDPKIEYIAMVDLNLTLELFGRLGYGKNSEIYRKLYREMGYSLSGCWEIFHWAVNNPDAAQYRPPMNGLKVIRDFCEKQNETMKNSMTPDKGEHYVASMNFAITRYQHVINLSNALLNETSITI